MLAWFRRQRFVAALLIAANPALIGSWVAAYHPCPVSDGALGRWRVGAVESQAPAMSEHAGHEGMMMGEETAPAPSHDHSNTDGPCSCIGQCLSAGVALPLDAGRESRVSILVTQSEVSVPQSALVVPASRPHHLLPPSTAPPSA